MHRVRPTLFVFKNMNVPPLLSHIRSFSFLFVLFRSFFRSCVFLPFRSRARSFVGRIRARFVSFRFGVCDATRFRRLHLFLLPFVRVPARKR